MARYKQYNYDQQKLLPISFSRQILPGTFEYTLSYIIDHGKEKRGEKRKGRKGEGEKGTLPFSSHHSSASPAVENAMPAPPFSPVSE